jgi:hypothetical protein
MQNPSRAYTTNVLMAVADFTQFEIFMNLIETGAVLCITANFAADVRAFRHAIALFEGDQISPAQR